MPKKLTDKQEAYNYNPELLELCLVCKTKPVIKASYTIMSAYIAAFCNCGESFKKPYDVMSSLLGIPVKDELLNIVHNEWNKKNKGLRDD